MTTKPTWRADIDAPSVLKENTTLRFNVYFSLWLGEEKIDELYVVGLRMEYGIIKAPTFGAKFPFPSIYLSRQQAAVLDETMRRDLPKLRTHYGLSGSFDLAPEEVVIEELLIPLKHYGRIFPEASRWNQFKRL